ncbi:MAG TPA: hypothetical protein VEN28_01415 [Burkholderiaceae bacterium]|nr:hypothetical protein [Burkholderiaceae bacterium]
MRREFKKGQFFGPVRAGRSFSTSWLAAFAASLFLLAQTPAHAADDRFDRSRFDGLGGFQPVSDATYRKECGACHFAYLPGLLPARSWSRVLERLNDHFGESIELNAEVNVRLREYLNANAADKVPDRGAAVLLERLDPEKTPMRITQVPHILKMHIVVREVLKTNATAKVRSLANCDSCHQKATEGSFALGDLLVPGVTKVIRPGGAF